MTMAVDIPGKPLYQVGIEIDETWVSDLFADAQTLERAKKALGERKTKFRESLPEYFLAKERAEGHRKVLGSFAEKAVWSCFRLIADEKEDIGTKLAMCIVFTKLEE